MKEDRRIYQGMSRRKVAGTQWRFLFTFAGFFLVCIFLYARFPVYFHVTTENSLPSDEVYSMAKDSRGFVWIGCDAGLYRSDGVRFIPFSCPEQRSRSVSGLSITPAGKVWCLNFLGQIFCVTNDTMREVKHPFSHISNMSADNKGRVYVCHDDGISMYDDSQGKWHNWKDLDNDGSPDPVLTKSVRAAKDGKMHFVSPLGLSVLDGNNIVTDTSSLFTGNAANTCISEPWENETWIMSVNENHVFRDADGRVKEVFPPHLKRALQERKVNNLRALPDGFLWICTYSGIIRYDPRNDSLETFYPDVAFSDCLIDDENSYWFSTLQNGLMRVPDLNMEVWSSANTEMDDDRLLRLASDGTHIWFSSVSGSVGELDTYSGSLSMYNTGTKADIQSLDYDPSDHGVYFSINNKIFLLRDHHVTESSLAFPTVKSLVHRDSCFFMASSIGAYFYYPSSVPRNYKIYEGWMRDVEYDSVAGNVWMAGNNGLLRFSRVNGQWQQDKIFLAGTQVISLCRDAADGTLYAVTFDGAVCHPVNADSCEHIAQLPAGSQVRQLLARNGNIYVGTNHGLWLWNAQEKSWRAMDKAAGLVSENIQSICFCGDDLWLATVKGLQKIPHGNWKDKPLAKVYLADVRVDNLPVAAGVTETQLNYDQSLSFRLEAPAYGSNGDFHYAYRVPAIDSSWVVVPASIGRVEILNLPSGHFTMEMKVIDHFGRDSENRVYINGYVRPPFWQKWWFYSLEVIAVIAFSFLLFRRRMKKLRREQLQEIEKLTLENELRLAQQSALKAQMNPHFIFNVLNSIKGFIYENNKKEATEYLNNFSELVRKILHQSSQAMISLEDEMSALEYYIRLEALFFPGEFSYSIRISPEVDMTFTRIPPLLIQPYVENVFKHGLRHRKGAKRLDISIDMEDESLLVIEITDNGIGRKMSAEIHAKSGTSHESFATGAAEKRLRLLHYEKQRIVGVTVIDRVDDAGAAQGTTVILKIHTDE